MVNTLITLALAASAMAMPKPRQSSYSWVAFQAYTDLYYNVYATQNGTDSTDLVLVGQRPSLGAGTNATLIGPYDDYYALNFEYNGLTYGGYVPQVGDAYGTALPVTAIEGTDQFQWEYYNGTLYHKLQVALNSFYFCEDTVNGESAWVLSWGTPNNDGSAPTGCNLTNLILES